MLDFRRESSRVPNYLGRGEQRRLLMLFVALGLILLVASQVANPHNWNWFARLTGQAPKHVIVDNRLPEPKPGPAGDAVVIAGPALARGGDRKQPLFPGIDASLLDQVRDDTQLRSAELPAFYQLLSVLEKADSRSLHEASAGQKTFLQLFEQPRAYRGDVVRVSGKVRGAFHRESAKNPEGIKGYYELWIEPEEYTAPIVVDCLDLPAAFPLGDKLDQPAHVTGFFFKRWAYLAQDHEMRTAPLVLAKSIQWVPAAAEKNEQPSSDWKEIALAISAALLISIGLLLYLRPRRAEKRGPYAAPSGQGGMAPLDDLRELEVAPDVREALREIATRAADEPVSKKPEGS